MLRLRQHPPALYVSSRRSGLSALQGEAVPAAVGHEAKRGGPAAPGLGFPRGNRGTATRPRSATVRSHTSRTPGSGTKRKHPADLFSAPPAACHELGWKRHDALKKHPKPKNTRARPTSRPSCSSWGAAPPSFSPDFLGGAFPLAQPPRRLSPGFPNAPWVSKRPPRLHSRPPRRQHQPRGEPHSAQSPPRGGRRGRASPLSSPRPPARCLPP